MYYAYNPGRIKRHQVILAEHLRQRDAVLSCSAASKAFFLKAAAAARAGAWPWLRFIYNWYRDANLQKGWHLFIAHQTAAGCGLLDDNCGDENSGHSPAELNGVK